MSTQDIYHYVKINDQLITSGQPTEEQLKSIAAEGFQAVINLAPHDSRNALADEAGVVRSVSMAYHYIPVDWEHPHASDFDQFTQTLKQIEGHKVLIHCAANYRVTAFYGLYAMQELKWSEAQADELMAHFWKHGEYPIWDMFINRMKAQIKNLLTHSK
jgi:protein tyrosine phosphatase (PTP) superfamily phosphohydrolase (DUF442 family)